MFNFEDIHFQIGHVLNSSTTLRLIQLAKKSLTLYIKDNHCLGNREMQRNEWLIPQTSWYFGFAIHLAQLFKEQITLIFVKLRWVVYYIYRILIHWPPCYFVWIVVCLVKSYSWHLFTLWGKSFYPLDNYSKNPHVRT